jgi:hypothetical protein
MLSTTSHVPSWLNIANNASGVSLTAQVRACILLQVEQTMNRWQQDWLRQQALLHAVKFSGYLTYAR